MYWRVGVVGFPVSHSRSPQLHQIGLDAAGLDGQSDRVPLPLEEAHLLRDMMGRDYDALSVTMPLKSAAFALCDEVSEAAATLGVVNSILWRDGSLWGDCTDGEGFVDAAVDQCGVTIVGLSAVVLGSGGSATAIVDALVRHGAARVHVLARNAETASRIRSMAPSIVTTEAPVGSVGMIVNTIPVTSRAIPEVLACVNAGTVAIDITYDPVVSPWRAAHDNLGCQTLNGLPMLAYQAARQLRWWWNVEVPGAELLAGIA